MCNSLSILACILLSLCAACSAPSKVRVEERATIDSRIETEKIGGSRIRIVQSGDTLHALAFASSLSVQQLAAWNNLSDTGKLQIGQRIRLTRPLNYVPPPNPAKARPKKNRPIAVESVPAGKDDAASNVAKRPPKSSAASQKRSWIWPVDGKVIGRFASSQTQQGIDIQGKLGQTVVAAMPGEVVYVGNGLKGYGNLVIIKHDEIFLSAYAHNQETFVREGQQVSARASVGSVGLDKRKRQSLHFQIRKHGKPVNPLTYLPKR